MTDRQTQTVAEAIRIALFRQGIGFSLVDDRLGRGNSSVYINIEAIAKMVLASLPKDIRNG